MCIYLGKSSAQRETVAIDVIWLEFKFSSVESGADPGMGNRARLLKQEHPSGLDLVMLEYP